MAVLQPAGDSDPPRPSLTDRFNKAAQYPPENPPDGPDDATGDFNRAAGLPPSQGKPTAELNFSGSRKLGGYTRTVMNRSAAAKEYQRSKALGGVGDDNFRLTPTFNKAAAEKPPTPQVFVDAARNLTPDQRKRMLKDKLKQAFNEAARNDLYPPR